MVEPAETVLALDLRGLKCPLPVLKTRRKMAELSPGSTVSVEAGAGSLYLFDAVSEKALGRA